MITTITADILIKYLNFLLNFNLTINYPKKMLILLPARLHRVPFF